ncbi:MAG: YigZ family protein [Kordiimonadaceae bacterium]|jgi:uncharacterized YigZ family protein|nr:YigZ family protein [Kordiimonadaceae bacterium]MBT6036027.1 YigZ family protein [Kordiimonadaceae bacterium]MBT6330542.1 YigZ family protein [Kordiimonadaceae bacterium]
MAENSYHIPKNTVFYQQVIKRSRFIVHIGHTADVEQARAYIHDIKEKYSDAGHNCWAYVAGDPADSQILGFSDDGEPNGTAGKPILNVLMGSGVGEITAVVTRYFGGIKLGTGGLVRAYGGSVNQALEELITAERIPEIIVEGVSEYSHQDVIDHILKDYNILSLDKEYGEHVSWKIKMDEREAPLAISEILDKTSGRVQFTLPEEISENL